MFNTIKKVKQALRIYLYDFRKDMAFTSLKNGKHKTKESLLAFATVSAHTIEKGLTMPQKRFNFGHDKVKLVVKDLFYCADHFDSDGERFADVAGIVKEYVRWHRDNGVSISDPELVSLLDEFEKRFPTIVPVEQYYNVAKETFFSKKDSSFAEFSKSRHSCRNFCGSIDEAALESALKLATATVPSTCNRQSVRVHMFNSKKILDIQKGNRGFGHLAAKYLLVTSSLRYWTSNSLRNGPYVDGGIFVMNLLYALHYNKIAACTLNMYLDVEDSKRVHAELDVPEDEVFVALIAVGSPSDTFDLARSTRKKLDEIVFVH